MNLDGYMSRCRPKKIFMDCENDDMHQSKVSAEMTAGYEGRKIHVVPTPHKWEKDKRIMMDLIQFKNFISAFTYQILRYYGGFR